MPFTNVLELESRFSKFSNRVGLKTSYCISDYLLGDSSALSVILKTALPTDILELCPRQMILFE